MLHQSITGITNDSRKVKPGFAFVAIKGEKEDGHQYIDEAIKGGAKLIVCQKKPKKVKVPAIEVADTRYALSSMAASFYKEPAKGLKTIGITGTNGKSTTAYLLYHLLGDKAGLISTVGSITGGEDHPSLLTTPDAVKMHSLLSLMKNNALKYGIIEVSSHGIHQHRVAHIDFQVLIHTNISEDHLDYHQDFQRYLAVKKSFFTNKRGIALFNRDDPYFPQLSSQVERPFYTYGIKEGANIRAIRIREKGLSSSFTISLHLQGKKQNYQVHLPLPGIHNIYNALASFGAALLLDQDPKELMKRIWTFPGVWRRMQITQKNGFTIMDDCAHNPLSYRSLLSSIQRLPFKRIFFINAIRGNRGEWINRENAKIIGSFWPKLSPSSLYITSARDMAKENDQVQINEEKTFLHTLSQYGDDYSFTYTLSETLKKINKKLREGDLLLLVGAHAFDQAKEKALRELKLL